MQPIFSRPPCAYTGIQRTDSRKLEERREPTKTAALLVVTSRCPVVQPFDESVRWEVPFFVFSTLHTLDRSSVTTVVISRQMYSWYV